MAELNPSNSTTTNMRSAVRDFSVAAKQTDGVNAAGETYYDYPKFTISHAYYKDIPELKKAIDALANWTVGKGYEVDEYMKPILRRINGSGKDTFTSILWNMFVVAKFNGDAFAEIIRDEGTGTLLNLKILDPSSMRAVFDTRGILVRYEQRSKIAATSEPKKFSPEKIFHLMHDRIADEIHGTGVVESCKWVIDARNEAMSDKRRVHHRSTIRIIEVDTDDTQKIADLNVQYQNAINNGEVMIVPKGNVTFPEATIAYLDTQEWIQYLEGFFYQAVGVPRVIATAENYTEAGGKVGYATFEPVYTREQVLYEEQIRRQLGIQLLFNRPPSLTDHMMENEQKNTGQTSFQPNDVQLGSGAA